MRRFVPILAALAATVTLGFAGPANASGGHGHGCDRHYGNGHHECDPPVVNPPIIIIVNPPGVTPPTPVPSTFNLIIGTRFRDRLPGTSGRDAIFGLGGNDSLIGRRGADRLYGNRGNDTLRGGLGSRDVLSGGRGFDTCIGDSNDVMRSCERRIVV